MLTIRPQPVAICMTDPIDVTFGAFQIGPYRVPYAASVLRFQQVAEYLNLVTDDPKYAKQDWSIGELYQREVDQARVLDIADNYLDPERASRPPFFNSLTVVLNPVDGPGGAYSAPPPDPDYLEQVTVGPIQVSFAVQDDGGGYPKNGTFGRLRWNRDQVYAVAIDGQHRLAALKHLWQNDRRSVTNSDISVIFIVIGEELGFSTPGPLDSVRLMRSIFVDLNKLAVSVSRARTLLLDDYDPTARCVRELFGPSLAYTPTETMTRTGFRRGTNGEFDDCLPLELVDWHGESKSKVESGPYVTSVLALEWTVGRVLKANYPSHRDLRPSEWSPDDDDYYGDLRRKLSTWSRSWEQGLEEAVKECEDTERPFILTHDHLDWLGAEFRATWGQALTRLLTTAGPYHDLARYRVETDTLTPQFGQWFQAVAASQARQNQGKGIREYYEARKSEIEEELRVSGLLVKQFRDIVESIETNLKKDSVFFYLVGQRALTIALIDLVGSRRGDSWAALAGLDLDSYAACFQDLYADYLVQGVNAVYRQGASEKDVFAKGCRVQREPNRLTEGLSSAFWAASLVKRDDPDQIDFSDSAAVRGSKWFALIAHLHWFLKVNREEVTREVVLESVESPRAIDGLPFAQELTECIGRIIGDESPPNRYFQSPMAFLQGNEDWQLEVSQTATRERVSHLLDLFGVV
jgi:DGQHR domain-containing protein